MPRGKTYELKAVFSAENKAGRTIAALERRLEKLQTRINSLSKEDADIGITEHGATETGARIDNLERKVKKFDGMEGEAEVGVDEKKLNTSVNKLYDLEKRIKNMTRRPSVMDLKVNSAEAERTIRTVGAEARELARRAYVLEMRAEADGFTDVMADAARLKREAQDINNTRMQLIAEMKGVPKVLRDAGLMKVALNEVEGTYSIKIDTRSLLSARGAATAVGAGFKALAGTLQTMQPISQSFAQKVYIMQQAMSVFRVAIMAVAVAAAGPLVAGLTILGSSLLALAGGFGLVAMAAAPIISHFANAEEKANQLETAQNELKSAQESAASSAQAVADAQRGVGEAYRAGQEQIRGAIQAHADAQRAVTDAQRAYGESVRGIAEAERDAHEGVQSAIQAHADALRQVQSAQDSYADAQEQARDATRDVRFATQEYNSALATEQFRLRSMQLDISGMRLSQKQLAFDMREARMELQRAENPRERKEAQLRLQQLELQRKQNILDMGQAQRELNEAQKKGTDELQSAQEARRQALDSQKDAQQGVVDAMREVADAQRNATQAEKEIARARAEGNRQIREAQRTAQESQRAVQEAMRNERRAQREIGRARQDAARQMAEANRALAEANRNMAKAQQEVKEKQSALNALMGKTPKHIQAIENAIARFKNVYTRSFAGAQVATGRLATRLINIGTRALPALGRTAQRTVQGLNKALSTVSRNFRNFGVIESLQKILKTMPNITKNWTQAIGNFGGAFINIMGQAMPFARRLAVAVRETSRRFLEWTDSEKGRAQIKRFFQSAAPVAQALWKQITRIGGALLKWATQSKEGPKTIAKWITRIGDIVMGTAHLIGRMVRLWNRLPQPVREFATEVALAWIALRIFFGSRVLIGLARLAIGFGKVSARILGLRQAAVRTAVWMVKPFRESVRVISGVWKVIPKRWASVMKVLPAMSTIAVRGIALAFARISIVGLAFEVLVRMVGAAYNEITRRTMPTVVGLVKMWRKGDMSIGKMWFNMARQMMSSMQRIVIGGVAGTVNSIQRMFAGLFNWIGGKFGNNKLGDIMFGDWKKDGPMTKALKGFTNWVRGDTNKMAADMVKNSKQGTMGTIMNMNKMNQKGTKATKDFSLNTEQQLTKTKLAMVNKSAEGEKGTTKNMWDTARGGNNAMKDLFKGTDFNMNEAMKSSNKSTGSMKETGIKDFWDFNKGGTNASEDLKLASSMKMLDMQTKVNKSTEKTQQESVKDLVDMQEQGTGAMTEAQQKWVSKAWMTSTQTQESFNAILEGIGRFIDKADIDMKKPEQFSVIYNKGSLIGGGSDSPGLTPHQRRLATGDVIKYGSGGEQGPSGGVSAGTTRVYGEVPGTTEFYITDNKKHRKRNMEILQAANQHMNFAKGGEIVHDERTGVYKQNGVDYEAAAIKKGRINLMRGDHELGLRGPLSGRALKASQGWQAPSTFSRGRDVRVFYKHGIGAARTGSNGTIGVDPNFRGSPVLRPILQHELGHAGGLGHSSRGIMTAAVGPRSHISSAEKKWWHREHEARARGGGGGGRGGGGGGGGRNPNNPDDGMSKQEKRQAERQEKEDTAKDRRAARRSARKFRQRFNKGRKGSVPLGKPADYSRNAAWMARGGVLRNLNPIPNNDKQIDDNFRKIARAHKAHGPEHEDLPARRGGVDYEYLGATTHNWNEPAKSIQEATRKAVGGITTNTYVGHPGGEGNSVDHWGPGGRGARVGSKGDKVEKYILANHKKEMEYYIWKGIITGWGRSRRYNDPGDMHYDHLHATYPGGSPNLGGAGGRGGATGGGPSQEEINKWFEDAVPTMPNNLGYGMVGEAASMAGSKVREAAKEFYMSKVPTGGTGGVSGNAGPGLTMMEAITQGGFPASKRDTAVGVAWEESGGNAGAKNPSSTAYGLFQFLKSTAEGMGLSYSKMGDPVYASSAANKLSKGGKDWGPWAAYPPSSSSMNMGNKKITGYSNGGVVTRPHLGVIGDRGPEVNLPLHDPRALNMMRKAFDMSDRVSGGAMHRNKAIGEAIGTGQRIDQGTGSQRDGGIEQALQKAENKVDAAIEKAFDKVGNKLDNRIKELIQTEMDLSDANAEKFMRAGMKMMMEILQNPHIGGDIVNEHISRDVDFERELTKR